MESNTIPCESPSDNRRTTINPHTFSLYDSDSDSDSDSEDFIIEDEEKELANSVDNYVPKEVNHEEFVEGLQRIGREFDRHRDFIATLVGGIGRAGGFWWFDALSLALRA